MQVRSRARREIKSDRDGLGKRHPNVVRLAAKMGARGSSTNLRTVSEEQQVSRGMVYPTSWPMLTSISSATRRARSTACCLLVCVHTTIPCWYWADRQNSAHH